MAKCYPTPMCCGELMEDMADNIEEPEGNTDEDPEVFYWSHMWQCRLCGKTVRIQPKALIKVRVGLTDTAYYIMRR